MRNEFQLFETKKSKLYAWIVLVSIYLFLISFGFGPYISDDHAFRQTQTAFSALWIEDFSNIFYYITPLFGYPWSVPMEFPLYQYIVKLLSISTGISLETSGRLISVAFFLMCIYPIYCLLDYLHVKEKLVVISLIVLTPLYVFWSRSFMIETTALFFSLLYVKEFIRSISSTSPKILDFLSLFAIGSIAVLTKITTFLPLFFITSVAWLYQAYQYYKAVDCRKKLVSIALVQLVIFFIALAWVKHTDSVKLLNPLASMLTSDNLRIWNFGTFEQRFTPYIWVILINKTTNIYFPYLEDLWVIKNLFILILMFSYLYCWEKSSSKRKVQSILLIILFLFPFFIFTNLHRTHNYYQCANAIFLSASIGIVIVGALEQANEHSRKNILVLYALIIMLFCGNTLWYFYFKNSYSNEYEELNRFIKNNTLKDDVLLITGASYSSEIPFYSERKALMLPDSFPDKNIQLALMSAREQRIKIGAFISCNNHKKDTLVKMYFDIKDVYDLYISECKVYLMPKFKEI